MNTRIIIQQSLFLALAILPLSAAPIELVEQKPVEIKRLNSEVILIDFGKVAFGNLELTLPPGLEGQTTVHFGEAFNNGRIDRKPPGTVRYGTTTINAAGGSTVIAAPPADERNTELAYDIKSDGTKRFHPPAILTPEEWGVILPFRWVEIEGWPGELDQSQITRRSAFLTAWDDNAASFECSDETLNRIWDLCHYSLKATTFAGIYVDGDRERIPYEADAYLNQLSHYYTDGDKEIARDTIDHLLLNGTWPTEWAPHMVFMVYADYLHTGDIGWMAGRYGALKNETLMERRGEDNLVHSGEMDIKKHDIVDWPKKERDKFVFTPRNSVVNAFHIKSLELMAIMAHDLGLEDQAKEFKAQAASSRAAFDETFLDEKKGLYRDGIDTDHISSHANFFPLAFGITPENLREKKIDWLVEKGMCMSVYAAQYFLEALFENGADTEALALITADNDRSWKHMVNSGTTITWEAWGMKYKPNQDWNHAWGAAPGNLLPRYVLGAEPLTPGWKTARISPQIGELKSAKGKVPTIHGPLLIDWNNEGSFKISLKLPKGISALVDLPAASGSKEVLIDGKKVKAEKRGNRWILPETISDSVNIEVK